MKNLILVCVVLFSGCSQVDGIYGVGKNVYTVGKHVAPAVPMSEKTRETLNTVDNIAVKYDEARTEIRDQNKTQ